MVEINEIESRRPLSLGDQIEILFQYRKAQHLVVSYSGISRVTGESVANIRKIRLGENRNPGINTLRSILTYFGVGLDYLDCKTKKECWDYLSRQNPITNVIEERHGAKIPDFVNKQIMVVDDNKVSIELIELMLKKTGLVIHKAYGSTEAKQLFPQSVPDLFLVDYRMPEMNGLELCQYIRDHPLTKKTPVLLLTAQRLYPEFISQCIEAGASDCIQKPFAKKLLLAKIKTHLTYNLTGNYKERNP